MPNWCSSLICISHKDEHKVEKLYKHLQQWTSHDAKKNGFGHSWLGNVVLNSGVGTVDTGEQTDLRCRGSISDIDYDNGVLYITTETAWEPMTRMWLKVCEKYLPNANITYHAEESGDDLFETNDEDYRGRYYIDCWEDSCKYDSRWDAKESDVVEILQDVLKTRESDLGKLLDMLDEAEDVNISVHKWRFIPIEELD